MKTSNFNSLELKKVSISRLTASRVKGGLPTTKQSTVNPEPLRTYADCIPAGPVSSDNTTS